MDFKHLQEQGKTIIYKESESELSNDDWELWGKRKTENEEVFVYRKILTLEEALRHEVGN